MKDQFTKNIYNLQALNFLHSCKNINIGILGGSFNPSHSGHLAISQQALNFYQLDYVIWLVASQNPFKEKYDLSTDKRMQIAANIAKENPKIIISSLEQEMNFHYAIDSISFLVNRFANVEFSWLMGIDNITNFHKWKRANEIKKMCNIVVFDRPSDAHLLNIESFSLKSKGMLAKNKTNNIMVYRGKNFDVSSTEIRLKNLRV